MKLGLVDLDTSHPASWLPVEREMGHEIVGVWDGGSVHPAGYAEKFAEERDIPKVFASLDEMAREVDCAIIHSCNWDTHVDKARVFVEAGKAVLVDKPIAGNVRDLNQIRKWAKQGVKIAGGSSLRFCVETRDWLAQPESERGIPDTVLCGCGIDEFNYGSHAYSMLSGIMGPGAVSVRYLGKGIQRRIQVNWDNGRTGFLVIGAAELGIPFHASIMTGRGCTQYQAGGSNLYRALLGAVMPYLSGETDKPPLSADDFIEPELCAVAALKSLNEGNREVLLSELSESDTGYDGAAFALEYHNMKYPKQ